MKFSCRDQGPTISPLYFRLWTGPAEIRELAQRFRQAVTLRHDHPPLGLIPRGYRKGLMSRFL